MRSQQNHGRLAHGPKREMQPRQGESDDVSKLVHSAWRNQSLNLSHRNMKVAPSSLARLASLKVLLLNNNSLIMPPDEIQYLQQLESLSLEFNQLTIFPSCLSSLSSTLSFLNASNNPLTCLPPEMDLLQSWTSLWLDFTQLDSFPSVVLSLHNLCYLSLRGNHISSIPSSMATLNKLSWLSLASNKIRSIQAAESFSTMSSLHTIDLSKNGLTALLCVTLI